MGIFTELFAWWTGNTIGTRLYTWRKGVRVGEDGLGNIYYEERDGPRRWVTYRTLAEPSQIPPAWHAWLHRTVDVPPTDRELHAAPVGKGASSQYDRHLRGLSAARLDASPRRPHTAFGLRAVATQMKRAQLLDAAPPTPVQRWSASDYARERPLRAGARRTGLRHARRRSRASASSISAAATAR